MADKKAFLLRLDPSVWTDLERLAQAELRSINAEIEFLLRDALSRRGLKPKDGNDAAPARRRGKMD
ncbi:MAG: toxin-antitoxin system HicB family antitoxin [Betaproteobacteria bacterium]